MNEHAAEMTRIIREVDAEAAMRLHSHLWPQFPPPANVHEARATIHFARTGMKGMETKLRCYSHAWLRDEGLPSNLPDYLKKKADRLYPVGARGVGIAVRNRDERALGIRSAMELAVHETYADGHENEPQIVRARMLEMRRRFIKHAGG